MSRKFHVFIEPKTDVDIAALGMLRNHIGDYASRNGNGQCSTLGQIKFCSNGAPTLTGRLYTGEAVKYLDKHIRAANVMQNAEESSDKEKHDHD